MLIYLWKVFTYFLVLLYIFNFLRDAMLLLFYVGLRRNFLRDAISLLFT
jgi:hypothetical protein